MNAEITIHSPYGQVKPTVACDRVTFTLHVETDSYESYEVVFKRKDGHWTSALWQADELLDEWECLRKRQVPSQSLAITLYKAWQNNQD